MRMVAGIGCRKGVSAGEVEAAIAEAVPCGQALDALATGEIKRAEAGIVAAAAQLGVPIVFVGAEELVAVAPRALSRSARVETLLEPLPYTCSAWLVGDPATFKAPSASMIVKDQRGRVVVLFQDSLMKSIARDRNPDHVLKDMG